MPKTATANLVLQVGYDPEKTDPDSLASAFDTLLETALSTDGILDEYGEVSIGEFVVQNEDAHDTLGDDQ